MAKKKLLRFAELETFEHVHQPHFSEVLNTDYSWKGRWHEYFGNSNPIVLELGCGKGEYTLALARKYPNKNFLGFDIKGARIWRGARSALDEGLKNVAFIRVRIDLIASFFASFEVSEIWITFPDPQLYHPRKRLTSSRFLNLYALFLKPAGPIHLKTDSLVLYNYTNALLKHNQLQPTQSTSNLYGTHPHDELLSVRTFYESQYLARGKSICYVQFSIPVSVKISELPAEFAC